MVKTLTSNAGGVGLIPGQGEVGEMRSHMLLVKTKNKNKKHHPKLKSNIVSNSIDFENDPHLKNLKKRESNIQISH